MHLTSLLLNLCFIGFYEKVNAKAPTSHGITMERLAPLGLSLSGAGSGAETCFGVSPKLSLGQGHEAELGLTFSYRPDLAGLLLLRHALTRGS